MNVSVVIVCVDYAAMLARTLPHTMRLGFDEVVVVTTDEETGTREVVEQNGARLVVSNRCYDDGHAFNRGRMINDGLAVLAYSDWVLSTDADIFLHEKTVHVIRNRKLDAQKLYYVNRYAPDQPEDINTEPNGHFLLFSTCLTRIFTRFPKVFCEEFCSTGGYDSWLVQQYAPENRERLSLTIPCRHIPHGEYTANWNGNDRRNPVWRQIGVINRNNVVIMRSCSDIKRLRLVDTLNGNVAELCLDRDKLADVLSSDESGLVFMGRSIGVAHIHLSASEIAEESTHVQDPRRENPEGAHDSGRDAVDGAGSEIEQAPGDCRVPGSCGAESDLGRTGYGDCHGDQGCDTTTDSTSVGEVLHGPVGGLSTANGRLDQG